MPASQKGEDVDKTIAAFLRTDRDGDQDAIHQIHARAFG